METKKLFQGLLGLFSGQPGSRIGASLAGIIRAGIFK